LNAANPSLLGGGSMDEAIHRAGGSKILEECKTIRARQSGCKTGEAVLTTAGRLPAKCVIHTVGPVWQGGKQGEAELLANCYKSSLALAAAHGVKTIAFPSISTGMYGYPIVQACHIALTETLKLLGKDKCFERVIFVCFSAADYQTYQMVYSGITDKYDHHH
jgi:O-acetyl-ADP-ribose deacetylase